MGSGLLPFANDYEQVQHLRHIQKLLVQHMLILSDALHDIAETCSHDEEPQLNCPACKARQALNKTV